MRVKEFAEKYDIPYQIVYNSTWLVKKEPGVDEETMLKEAVRVHLTQRMKRHQVALDKDAKILAKLDVTKI